jgi:hypothetical protein
MSIYFYFNTEPTMTTQTKANGAFHSPQKGNSPRARGEAVDKVEVIDATAGIPPPRIKGLSEALGAASADDVLRAEHAGVEDAALQAVAAGVFDSHASDLAFASDATSVSTPTSASYAPYEAASPLTPASSASAGLGPDVLIASNVAGVEPETSLSDQDSAMAPGSPPPGDSWVVAAGNNDAGQALSSAQGAAEALGGSAPMGLILGGGAAAAGIALASSGTAGTAATAAPASHVPTQTTAITGAADDVSISQGNVFSGSSTDDSTLGLTGIISATLNAGEVVAVYDGATRLGTATVTGTGTSWSYMTPALALGGHSLTAQVEDTAGNHGAASAIYSITELVSTISLGAGKGQLIGPAKMTTNGNGLYYAWDTNNDGVINGSDVFTHNNIETLFGWGDNDQSTKVVNGVTIKLPTQAELLNLYTDPLPNPPGGWGANSWSSTQSGADVHAYVYLSVGGTGTTADSSTFFVVFQVL